MNFQILVGSAFISAALIASLGAYSQYIVQRAGIFSTSPAAFIAIGAYSSSFLLTQTAVPVFVAVLFAVVLCAVLGSLLGLLVGRLRGAYVAIATLAVVLVVQQIATVWTPVTGGSLGITSIPVWATVPVLCALVGIVIVFVIIYEVLPVGRRQASLRMDEIAAASIGTHVTAAGVIAMTVSSAIGGLAGAALAGNQFAIDPSTFGFGLVVTTLSAVVIGGYRSLSGPLLGGFVIVALPLVLSGYALVAGVIVGVATIAILRFFPRGLAGLVPISSESLATLARKLVGPLLKGKKYKDETSTRTLAADVTGSLKAVSMARSYGSVRAVADVSLEITSGKIIGLIGPNGAGKTSVINLLAGVTRLDSGAVTLQGEDVHKFPAFSIARLGIARTFQACRLFREMSVLDNVRMGATSGRSKSKRNSLPDSACARKALEIVGYQGSEERLAGELPYADQRRVEIARALATEPSFLLLDEPAAGMTETEAAGLSQVLRAISDLGIGILVIDHNVNWIFSVSDHVSVQHLGEIIATGDPAAVRSNPAVIEAYTGSPRKESHVQS